MQQKYALGLGLLLLAMGGGYYYYTTQIETPVEEVAKDDEDITREQTEAHMRQMDMSSKQNVPVFKTELHFGWTMDTLDTSYNDIPYMGRVHAQTHIERMALSARVFGIKAIPLERSPSTGTRLRRWFKHCQYGNQSSQCYVCWD